MFFPQKFQVFLIEERISKVKHLHFVSSVPPITYWVSAILWDMLMYLITSIIVRNRYYIYFFYLKNIFVKCIFLYLQCVVIFIIFDAEAYVAEESLPALLVIMFLYG